MPTYPLRAVLFAGAVALSSITTTSAQQVTRNVSYTTDAAGTHHADFYPAASGGAAAPVIVYLHGGSWRSGGKGNFSKLATDLAAQGYAGFSIDYDLHPHAWPLAFDETEAAIRFLHEHAAEYRIDAARIIVLGTSAGGQLAALAALTPRGEDTAVAAAIELNGVFDLHSSAHVITRYLGGKCGDVAEACDAASPMQHVHAGAPPFFIGHGTADHVVPFAEAQSFVALLKRAAVKVTTYDANDGPHMYWEKGSFYAANLEAIKKFLLALR